MSEEMPIDLIATFICSSGLQDVKQIEVQRLAEDYFRLMKQQKGNMQLLEMCKRKLEIYRDYSDSAYHGGIEHTALIGMINQALGDKA